MLVTLQFSLSVWKNQFDSLIFHFKKSLFINHRNNGVKMAEQTQKRISLQIPLLNNRNALLVSEVLNVDSELKGSGVTREITVKEDYIYVTFDGVEYKKLRVAVNAFMRNVLLVLKTLGLFG